MEDRRQDQSLSIFDHQSSIFDPLFAAASFYTSSRGLGEVTAKSRASVVVAVKSRNKVTSSQAINLSGVGNCPLAGRGFPRIEEHGCAKEVPMMTLPRGNGRTFGLDF
jgi:hypothetical protein